MSDKPCIKCGGSGKIDMPELTADLVCNHCGGMGIIFDVTTPHRVGPCPDCINLRAEVERLREAERTLERIIGEQKDTLVWSNEAYKALDAKLERLVGRLKGFVSAYHPEYFSATPRNDLQEIINEAQLDSNGQSTGPTSGGRTEE